MTAALASCMHELLCICAPCRRNIVVHSDNTTAEHGVRKGRARCAQRTPVCSQIYAAHFLANVYRTFDHGCIVHSIWAMVWQMGCGMYVVRVPSKENLADDPSRERYGLLARMKVHIADAACVYTWGSSMYARGRRKR